MYNNHKGIFLPMSIHLVFNKSMNHVQNENYLRMLRLPVNLFNRRSRPAFDDVATF